MQFLKELLSSLGLEFNPLTRTKVQTPFFLLGFRSSVEAACVPRCRETGLLCKARCLRWDEAPAGPAARLLGWSSPTASSLGGHDSRTCVCLCLAMQLRACFYLRLAQVENMCLLARMKRPPTAGSSLSLLSQAVCTSVCPFLTSSQACVPWDWGKELQFLVISQSEIRFAEVALFNYGFSTVQSQSAGNATASHESAPPPGLQTYQ